MLGEIIAGILSGFILSTQLDLSNMEAFQRGLRQGFRQSLLVSLGSTLGDAIYWIVMLLGHHKILESVQNNKVYIVIYAFFLLVLGFLSFMDLKRFDENKTAYNNKILVFMTSPFIAGFIMSVLTPSTLLWSFVVTEIFEQRLLPKATSMSVEPRIFIGLIIGGVLWAVFLAFLSSKSQVFVRDKLMKFFILINGILFFVSSVMVFVQIIK